MTIDTHFHLSSEVSGGIALMRAFCRGRLNIKCESAV